MASGGGGKVSAVVQELSKPKVPTLGPKQIGGISAADASTAASSSDARPAKARTTPTKSAPPKLLDEAIVGPDSPHAPEIYSMAAGDNDDELSPGGTPSNWNTIQLEGALDEFDEEGNSRDEAAELALSREEQQHYEEIDRQFERFKSRQNEVEKNVAELLTRLNTRMHIPSSVASSECGETFSYASSEWDTESLGLTEDGLSMLGSRVGSRAGTPPSLSPLGSPRDAAASLLNRMNASSSSGQLSSSRGAEIYRQLKASESAPSVGYRSHEGGRGSGQVGERGDLSQRSGRDVTPKKGALGALSSSPPPREAAASAASRATQQPGAAAPAASVEASGQDAAPRLTQQLLASKAGQEGPAAPAAAVAPMLTAPNAEPKQAWGSPQSLCTRVPGSTTPAVGGPTAGSSPPEQEAEEAEAQANAQRLPQFGAPEATGILAEGGTSEDDELARWQGWTVVATIEGRLFFHNEARQVSQWVQPPELSSILGDWEEIADESQPSQPSFWRNEQLRISLWKDPRQTSNIFQAALDGNLFFMQLYAEVDGQLDVVDPRGRSALHYSCAGGATQSALFLLQRSAEVDRRDDGQATPLIFACRYGYASVVKVLLDARADLSAACEGGNTALHEASAMGQLDCLHLLLLCGADASVRNNEDQVAADIASERRHWSCLTLLRRHSQPAHRPGGVPRPRSAAGAHSTAPAPAASAARAEGPPSGAGAQGAAVAAAGEQARPATAGARQRNPERKSREGPRVEYDDSSSGDSESDLGEVFGRAGDDVGATSESSDGGGPRGEGQGRSKRGGKSRRRERSPETSGLLGKMKGAFTSATRWAFPVQADLGLPNGYVYNEETKQWELSGGGSGGQKS